MQEDLDLALKRISELERRLEKYYQLLHIDNELDFVLLKRSLDLYLIKIEFWS